MKSKHGTNARLRHTLALGSFAMTLSLGLGAAAAHAQGGDGDAVAHPQGGEENAALPADSCLRSGTCPVHTIYLANSIKGNESDDIITALRNVLLPGDKIYFVESQNAILVEAPPEQLALAQKLLTDLDRPKKTYLLTYTVAETDAGKSVGTQHFSMIVVSGQETILKEGSKVPVLTGSFSPSASTSSQGMGVQTQYTYLDVGMIFDATLEDFANGVRLRSKVEQSSIAEEKSGSIPPDPIVRQSILQGTSFLTPGKPLLLGSIDIPGSTRHLDIDVVMDLVH